MYKKILVALALDQGHGQRAMELARRLKAEDGSITAVHVIEQVPFYATHHLTADQEKEIRQEVVKAIGERVGPAGDAEAVVLTGHSGRTITDYAEKTGADCIICGSHKPGMADFFLGSTAARIMRYAPCSVHVLRQ